MAIDLSVRLVPIPGIPHLNLLSPLNLLAPLPGTWVGSGFNQIFRPFQPSQGSDFFLELNLTNETLEFTEIPGEIPNRGEVQADISLFGMTYLQQVQDANVKDTSGQPAGIHIEPGIWLNVPVTQNPPEPATVARLANIPHGTSLTSQGTAQVVAGPPVFQPVDITPFTIGNPANKIPFPATTLSTPSTFRSPDSDLVGITQQMVDNPNSVLTAALVGKTINSTTVIQVSTAASTPNAGGGISDIAFLDGTNNSPNAHVARMDATFWISDFTGPGGSGTLLQYSQTVLLNFNGLSWPHVSVANLIKQGTKPKETKEGKEGKEGKEKIESKEHKSELKEHKAEAKAEGKEHKEQLKNEIKELETPVHLPFHPPVGPAGPAGPAAAAPAPGRHFIAPEERPVVGDAPAAPSAGADGPAPHPEAEPAKGETTGDASAT